MIGGLVLVWILLVLLLGSVFWIWMLVDCATKESDTGNTKVVWVIILVFTHIIGAAIYYFVRRPQRYAELHR
jgi:prolipoprotein diacylglyceryltransferase